MPNKVYIPNKSGHDFSKAERFGDLVFITDGFIGKKDTNMMQRIAEEKMKDSEPDDLIMITGLTILNSVITNIFTAKHGKVNYLIHDAKAEDYIIRKQVYTNNI